MSGMIISNPTMSTKFVMISTNNLPLAALETRPLTADARVRSGEATLVFRLPERRRRYRSANHTGKRDDRESVRNHLYELRCNCVVPLQLDL